MFYTFASSIRHSQEQLEDILLLVKAEEMSCELKERLPGNIRSSIQELKDLHKLSYVGSVHGAGIMLEMGKEKADPEFTVADK
jgi:hypothetical protein